MPGFALNLAFSAKKDQLTTKIEIKEEPHSSSPTKPSSSSGSGKSKHKSASDKLLSKEAKQPKVENTEEKLIDGKTKEEIETEERERMQ